MEWKVNFGMDYGSCSKWNGRLFYIGCVYFHINDIIAFRFILSQLHSLRVTRHPVLNETVSYFHLILSVPTFS